MEGRTQKESQGWTPWAGIGAGKTQAPILYSTHNKGDRIAFSDQMRIRLIKTGNIKTGALGEYRLFLRWYQADIKLEYGKAGFFFGRPDNLGCL